MNTSTFSFILFARRSLGEGWSSVEGCRTGKILTYFSVALLLFFVNQTFCADVDGIRNPYQKELNALKEKNIKIKMEIDNWSDESKHQNHEIDLIKETLWQEDKPLSTLKGFSNFCSSLKLAVNGYRRTHSNVPRFYLYKYQLPEIFNLVNKFSSRVDIYINEIYIDFNSNSKDLLQYKKRLEYSHSAGNTRYYNIYYDLILTKKCFEPFTKEEFEISLAKVFSNIKNKDPLGDIVAITAFLVMVQAFPMFWSLGVSLDDGVSPILSGAIAAAWAGLFYAEFLLVIKWIKKSFKDLDLNALVLLDDPKEYLENHVMSLPPEELKKQYTLIIDRVNKEIQKKYPERASKLKKEILTDYLKNKGDLNDSSRVTKFVQKHFWPMPTQYERIKYTKDRIKELEVENV